MTDLSQQNLREPEPCDWDNAFSGGKYVAPPPALDGNGKPITYYGKVVEMKEVDPREGYLNFQVDLVFINSGAADGAKVRTWLSTEPMTKYVEGGERTPIKGNPNKLAKFLKSAGLQTKPQKNEDYRAALRAVNGKAIPFTIDWKARDKDSGEEVKGYNAFPDDPERPGLKKSILKAGDQYNEVDFKGTILGTKTVSSEVLFANPTLKYFQDPPNKVAAR